MIEYAIDLILSLFIKLNQPKGDELIIKRF